MKTTVLAIAFTVASAALTFAAQTPAKPAVPAASSQTAPAAKTSNSTVKKTVKKHSSKKAVKDTSKPASTGGNLSR